MVTSIKTETTSGSCLSHVGRGRGEVPQHLSPQTPDSGWEFGAKAWRLVEGPGHSGSYPTLPRPTDIGSNPAPLPWPWISCCSSLYPNFIIWKKESLQTFPRTVQRAPPWPSSQRVSCTALCLQQGWGLLEEQAVVTGSTWDLWDTSLVRGRQSGH